jgi:carboxypeptidase Q
MSRRCFTLALIAVSVVAHPASAQTFPVTDPVLSRIWSQGMDSSQVYPLLQTLTDSIGPRLTGSAGQRAGNQWLLSMYSKWGIPARNEQYGTWRGWRRGITHVDLISPRVRSLEATMLAWSPGTNERRKPARSGGPATLGAARDVDGPLILLPDLPDSSAYARWLPQVRGKYVLMSFPQPTCRPDTSWRAFATDSSYARMRRERTAANTAWNARVTKSGYTTRSLPKAFENNGALGVITSLWSNGWGVQKIFQARTDSIPTLDVSCEDYGLIARLAANQQNPVIRVRADAEFTGDQPVFNTVAEMKGKEKPDEYVLLSAHFDSWDGSSGATDNGTGTTAMLEAMRILKKVYPNPKRTIIVGHWSGEEQGLNGSRAFAADHPEIVKGLQAQFNQDNGTGRVSTISAQGLSAASASLARWGSELPTEISQHITWTFPGDPSGGGSDNASFICAGAPGFGLYSNSWEYGTYTWHTNRDTFDKISFDDLKNNATLVAMLAYLASEDPVTTPRDRRIMAADTTGKPAPWPACRQPARSIRESTR